jgi:hypothetical protein
MPQRSLIITAEQLLSIVLPSQRQGTILWDQCHFKKQSTIDAVLQSTIALENNDFPRHKQLKPKGQAHITDTTTTNFASRSSD